MSCSIHPLCETPQDCTACYKSWPNKEKKRYTRAQCKRRNWIGKVDCRCENAIIGHLNFKEIYEGKETEEDVHDERTVDVRSIVRNVSYEKRRRNRPRGKYVSKPNTRKRPVKSA